MDDILEFKYAYIKEESYKFIISPTNIKPSKFNDNAFRDIKIIFKENNRVHLNAISIPNYFFYTKNKKMYSNEYFIKNVFPQLIIPEDKIIYIKKSWLTPWKKEKWINIGYYEYNNEFISQYEEILCNDISNDSLVINYEFIEYQNKHTTSKEN